MLLLPWCIYFKAVAALKLAYNLQDRIRAAWALARLGRLPAAHLMEAVLVHLKVEELKVHVGLTLLEQLQVVHFCAVIELYLFLYGPGQMCSSGIVMRQL